MSEIKPVILLPTGAGKTPPQQLVAVRFDFLKARVSLLESV
ncbi:hypothetical protein NWP17_10560 [Chrysosporum bergii ANA360D]|uniref:Uncharacterized protein n=1 Tax=Chrysosporum bergii ANA360D TaxID=617107 RepID=A0AA43GSV6_9CYAN|nr:hypothetical protein [Chrysosporum bergii]MDH6060876.1 hypothetical protein [Chrysosporum bergii ANA360D]